MTSAFVKFGCEEVDKKLAKSDTPTLQIFTDLIDVGYRSCAVSLQDAIRDGVCVRAPADTGYRWFSGRASVAESLHTILALVYMVQCCYQN